jgi:hypothetical protein
MRKCFLALIATLGCTLTVVAASCGGKVVPGYVDDAGSYHAPDGAIVFGAGLHCVGFDAAAISVLDAAIAWNPSPTVGGECDAATQCDYLLPSGAPLVEAVCMAIGVEDASTCRLSDVTMNVLNPTVPTCTPGLDGDAYCGAFFQQFVAALNAHAIGRCAQCRDVTGSSGQRNYCKVPYAGYCVSDCPFPAVSFEEGALLGHLSVVRGDQPPHCEVPCQP